VGGRAGDPKSYDSTDSQVIYKQDSEFRPQRANHTYVSVTDRNNL